MKTVYEEALQDMIKLREVAEANARNTIIDSLAPKLKDLIEKNLAESVEECDTMDEGDFAGASGVAAHPEMTGATSGGEEEAGGGDTETEETSGSFEVKEESYEPLFHLSNLAGPALADRIVAEVYKTYDSVNEVVTGARTMNSDELNTTIRKIEDIYSYLQENSVENKAKLEEKLETCYGLLNSFRESKMKMKDLVAEDKSVASEKLAEEKDVTLRITGLPDDVELENLNIDIISDEDPMGDEGGEDPAADGMDAAPPMGDEPPAAPAGPPGVGEAYDVLETDGDEDEEEEDVLSDDTVVEVSIPMLRSAIAAVKEAKKCAVDKEVLKNFGGGKADGDPLLDSDLEKLSETDGASDVDSMLKIAQKDLSESKAWYLKQVGTKKEADARKVVERAAKRFERIKELADKRRGPAAKRVDEAALKNKAVQSELVETRQLNDGLRKQLAEVNLLNSKLIHANKLLQREGLSKSQKVLVIDRLDEAMSLREVKLIYESLIKAFEDDSQSGSVNESVSRRVKTSGSSSRTTASSDRPVLSEGMETARWLELAGLSTK